MSSDLDRLPTHMRTALLCPDPERVEAPVADLLNLVLSGLAVCRKDNTVFLNDAGLRLRTRLTALGEKQ